MCSTLTYVRNYCYEIVILCIYSESTLLQRSPNAIVHCIIIFPQTIELTTNDRTLQRICGFLPRNCCANPSKFRWDPAGNNGNRVLAFTLNPHHHPNGMYVLSPTPYSQKFDASQDLVGCINAQYTVLYIPVKPRQLYQFFFKGLMSQGFSVTGPTRQVLLQIYT